jgi:diguanylate cyclase (GGDEF)-like protein/putative nucleotidyltransferase with HDIG domain
MAKFSLRTKIYIYCTLLGGIILLAISIPRWNWQETWIQTLVLCGLGGLTLLFKVEGTTDRTHYDITFLIYGCTLILFGAPAAVIVIVVAHVIEWIWHRYPWYIQSFNIASYIIVAVAANMVYELANPTRSMSTWQGALSILTAMAVFTLLNNLMVGLIVWMARGENFAQSGIFQFFPLMLDWILLSMGAGAAVVWSYNPAAVVLILLPLYLIYTTLRVPALERQIETDTKTGLFNQKFFMESLEAELSRAARFDHPLTVVMADMDLLRNINNTYGHLAGDEVLIGVARILKTLSREYDIVSRFGGEEFAILLPETAPEEVYPKIQAMRSAIERAEFPVPTSLKPIKATMSFGIAGRQPGLTGRAIIHNADMALYQAKLNGRNRVYVTSEEGFINPSQPQSESNATRFDSINDRPGEPIEPAIPYVTEPPASAAAAEAPNKSRLVLRRNAKQWVDLFILTLALGAIGIFLITIQHSPPVDWLGVLVFSILVAVTEWESIDIYIRKTAVSTSAVPLIAGILLFGPLSAMIMSVIIATVALIKHKSPFSRFVFNASNQLVATTICIFLVYLTGSNFTEWSVPLQILGSSIATMLVYLITSLFIAIGISISSRDPVRHIWNEQFSWLAPYYLGMGLIAYSLIFSYLYSGVVGTVVILVPLVLLRVSQKQFIDRTRDTVKELKEKNNILEENTGEIFRLNNGLLDTLAEVIDLRDPFVLGHSQQVTYYATMIAQQMGLPTEKIEIIRKACLMHDVGKLGIDASLLSKPSGLSDKEFETVKRHVTFGAELLLKSQALQSLVPVVLHHHEHYDGSGYPDRLKGEEIPLEARIVCVADSVEAMASDRPYRSALDFYEILAEVRRCSGSHFDPAVVAAFEQIAQKKGPSLIKNINYKAVANN